MLLKVKPKKMSIYVSNGKLTCAQVRQRTGCDICINGSLYNFSTFKPLCDVKADGTVLSDDQYGYWGYGWNKNAARATMSNQMSKWDNYVSCIALLKDGRKLTMTYGKDVGGIRGRTAIGYTNDGTLVIYCYADGTTGACTPEQLATKMLGYGCMDALCLDGGGSSQIESDNGRVTSSRKVANYICIWIDKGSSSPLPAVKLVCPYKEPATTVRLGTRGDSARWTQWYLNQVSGAGLTVDGIFGALSVTALKKFQKSAGLTDDGLSGKLTREALKRAY